MPKYKIGFSLGALKLELTVDVDQVDQDLPKASQAIVDPPTMSSDASGEVVHHALARARERTGIQSLTFPDIVTIRNEIANTQMRPYALSASSDDQAVFVIDRIGLPSLPFNLITEEHYEEIVDALKDAYLREPSKPRSSGSGKKERAKWDTSRLLVETQEYQDLRDKSTSQLKKLGAEALKVKAKAAGFKLTLFRVKADEDEADKIIEVAKSKIGIRESDKPRTLPKPDYDDEQEEEDVRPAKAGKK
ncbi:MAG: hypothetical protein HC875_10535 [Anaerolineales bacterium]|nr:hypothetical protein [Anaerolineales bacterium]